MDDGDFDGTLVLSFAGGCTTTDDGATGLDGDANGDGGRIDCDPRSAAVTAGTSGCPVGQTCLIVGSDDQVDCVDPGAERVKGEGASCASAAECLPGLTCTFIGGTQNCGAVCRCDAQGTACTATTANDCPTAGTHCTPLTNEIAFGVCLP